MATIAANPVTNIFAPMSARRLLVFGGIALVAAGMLLGDVFAVFILHPNAGRQGEALLAAAHAVAAKNPAAINGIFTGLGGVLEDRGTKVDAHVHMIDAGYLALLLALVQPFIAFSAARKKALAAWFLIGGAALPVGIFLIHYVGLAYSPFAVLGWASVLADSAGGLLIVVLVAEAWGYWKYLQAPHRQETPLPHDTSWAARALLSGGTILILAGFLHGAWYAGADLYKHEAMELSILHTMISAAATDNVSGASVEVTNFGKLAGAHAVNIAAHSHLIEFGLLAMLLSFVQPYVLLSERWRRRWVITLLGGSVVLPVFVALELHLGLIAGGIADLGGAAVLVALLGMLAGILRYTGNLDATGAGA